MWPAFCPRQLPGDGAPLRGTRRSLGPRRRPTGPRPGGRTREPTDAVRCPGRACAATPARSTAGSFTADRRRPPGRPPETGREDVAEHADRHLSAAPAAAGHAANLSDRNSVAVSVSQLHLGSRRPAVTAGSNRPGLHLRRRRKLVQRNIQAGAANSSPEARAHVPTESLRFSEFTKEEQSREQWAGPLLVRLRRRLDELDLHLRLLRPATLHVNSQRRADDLVDAARRHLIDGQGHHEPDHH